MLPVNDEGHCKSVYLVRQKCFYIKRSRKSNEKCHYHLHPGLILNSIDEPVAVICTNCVESIAHEKIPKNSIASKEDFGIGSRIGLETPSV